MESQDILSARHLNKRFGGLQAVRDFSFGVRRGSITGLIGPNGAGKSTTFNLISGYYKADSGDLEFEGKPIIGHSFSDIARQGLIRTFQHESFMKSMSVRDNILLGTLTKTRGHTARQHKVVEMAELVGVVGHLEEIAGNLPHGIQRLVSLAIALACKPALLCLDEPLTGLNNHEIQNILVLFRKLVQEFGMTVLLVEHNMKAVMSCCDWIFVLQNGALLASGSPSDIRSDPEVIKAYLG